MFLNEFILKCNALKKNVSETLDELRVLLSPQTHGINRVYELMKDLKNLLSPKTVLSENEKELLNDLKGLYSEESNPHYLHNMILKLIDMQQEFYSGLIPERKTKELFRAGWSSSIITQTNIIRSPLHEKYHPTEIGEVSVPEYAKLVAKSYMKTPEWKRYFHDEWAYVFSDNDYFNMIRSFYDSLDNFLNFFDLDDIAENRTYVRYNLKKCYSEILKHTTKCMSRYCPLETKEFEGKIQTKVSLFNGFDKKKFLEIFEDHNMFHGLYLKDVYNISKYNHVNKDKLPNVIQEKIEKVKRLFDAGKFNSPDPEDRLIREKKDSLNLNELESFDPHDSDLLEKLDELYSLVYNYKFNSKSLNQLSLNQLWYGLCFPTVMYVPLFVDDNKKSMKEVEKFIKSDFICNMKPFFSKGTTTQKFWPHMFICLFKATDQTNYYVIEEYVHKHLYENDVQDNCTVLILNI